MDCMIVRILKGRALPLAMIAGAVGGSFFLKLSFLTPYLIFTMLFLTFCNVNIEQMKPRRLHLILLAIQILGSIAVYLLLLPFSKIVAEGAMVCVICPTATAAAVITHKLGGNAATLTTYTLIGNIGTAAVVPIMFPIIEPHAQISFMLSLTVISGKVFPLLIAPFFAAFFLRRLLPNVHAKIQKLHEAAFYLWTVALAIVTAQTVDAIINEGDDNVVKICTALAAMTVCVLQFYFGKKIGSKYGERISAGQALGQKNTIFAIWMAHTYLNPLSAVGPGSYVLWQNIINSWQLWKKNRRDSAASASSQTPILSR